MRFEFIDSTLNAIFGITGCLQDDQNAFSIHSGVIKMLWNRNDRPLTIEIDGLPLQLQPQQITTVTYFHHLHFPKNDPPLTAMLFNREFYCISDHDDEISCNGILFFGTQDIPVIGIPGDQHRKFEALWNVILEEFKTRDTIQGEMLQMLLKRFIIICTRLAKEQLIVKTLNDAQIDIIRKYNFLVDIHFRTKRKVKEYAEMLHKSPKTLSNLFAIYNQSSPQQIIRERVVLEAKRLMRFTDKQTQEIAYDLGFDDPAHFSRYFKKVTGISPSGYREKHVSAL